MINLTYDLTADLDIDFEDSNPSKGLVASQYNKHTGYDNKLIDNQKELETYANNLTDIFGNSTIAITGWVTSPTTIYEYQKEIVIANVTAIDHVEIVIAVDSHEVASNAEICPTGTEGINKVTIYANAIPLEEIPFTYRVVKNNG